MEATFEEHVQERAVLVGLNADCFPKSQIATDETLDELEALLETAGGFCTGKILQNRHTPDSHSFIGEGKVEEVKELPFDYFDNRPNGKIVVRVTEYVNGLANFFTNFVMMFVIYIIKNEKLCME